MSAVREGPVMKLIIAPDIGRGPGRTWRASSITPTCSRRLEQPVAAEHRHVDVGQERGRARAARAGEQDQGPGLGQHEVGAGRRRAAAPRRVRAVAEAGRLVLVPRRAAAATA